MPAFATSTSTGPCASSAVLKASSTAAESRTSQVATVRPGTASPEREVMVTSSPSAGSLRAMASPIPRLPPVTRTDRLICGDTSGRTRQQVQFWRAYRHRQRDGGARPADQRAALGVLQPEADLEPDLEVRDLAIGDLAADLGHLEPVQVPQGLRRAVQRAADRGLDSLRGCAHDLGDTIGTFAHVPSRVEI